MRPGPVGLVVRGAAALFPGQAPGNAAPVEESLMIQILLKRSKSSALSAAPRQEVGERKDHLFYTGMSIASLLTVFVGFAPTYFLKGWFGGAPLTPLVHVHGVVFTCWIVLFFAQTVLIARHRIGLHRRLGVAGAALAALMVVVGLATTLAAAQSKFATGGAAALPFFTIPFGGVFVFAALVATGILYRRRPETHKRLMLLATINILEAAVARWPLPIMQAGPVAWFGVTDLFVLAGVGYDLVSRRRVHSAYVWGGLLLLSTQLLRMTVGHTQTWLAFASWLVR
jgi:hypothetical protein